MGKLLSRHAILWVVCLSLCGCTKFGIEQRQYNKNFYKEVVATSESVVEIMEENYNGEELKKIALTFDDGPVDVDGGTAYLLDGLFERNVRATFFVTGSRVAQNPDLTRRMYEEGHMIGNHSYNHVNLTLVSEENMRKEIDDTNKIIKSLTGKELAYMRPPYGAWNSRVESYTDMIPVMWTLDTRDWESRDTQNIVQKVVTNVKENDIILLHDGYKSSADAAFIIIDKLLEEGYTFVTVDELLLN